MYHSLFDRIIPPVSELKTEFSGTSEDLIELLSKAANNFGGWAGQDKKTGDHLLQFGTFLSTNPNTLRWRARVHQEGNNLLWTAETPTWPWTRKKYQRITDFRLTQLTDYVESHLRGGKNVHKFTSKGTRFPFVTIGRETAGITIAWTWLILSCLVCGVLTWIAMTIGSFLLMDQVIASNAERTALVHSLGGIALPSLLEIAETGFLLRLGCATSFAFAVAFFIGSMYGLIHVAGELWVPFSRAAWVPFVFFFVLLFLSLFPILALHSTIAISLLVPTVSHAGYTIVWGRKREKRRSLSLGKPKWKVILAGIALAGITIGTLTPTPREGTAVTDSMAGFRDRYLIPNPLGQSLARLYYRTTLYAAAPVKDFYDPSPRGYGRQIRTALLGGEAPLLKKRLRQRGFVVDQTTREKLKEQKNKHLYDVILLVAPGEPPSDQVLVVSPDIDPEPLQDKLFQASQTSFRATWLRDLAQVGWLTVFYLGPFALFSALAVFILPIISLVFRRLPRKWALGSLSTICLGSVLGLLLIFSASSDKIEATWAIRKTGLNDPNAATKLKPYFQGPDANIRFEAILRLYQHAKYRKDPVIGMTQPVIALLEDPDLRVRLWACGTLGKLRDPAAIAPLITMLEDPEFFVRYRAAEALGDLRARKAIDPLTKMTREDWWYCGMYALKALRKIAPGQF